MLLATYLANHKLYKIIITIIIIVIIYEKVLYNCLRFTAFVNVH